MPLGQVKVIEGVDGGRGTTRRGGDVLRRAGLLVGLGLAGLGATATTAVAMPARDAAAGPVGVHIKPLSQATLPARLRVHDDGVVIRTRGRTTLLVTAVTVEPGGSFGWHTHPGPVLVSVAKGTLTLYEPRGKSCGRTRVPTGHGFIEVGGDVHLARNEGTGPVELNATFLAGLGTTKFLSPVPQPSGATSDGTRTTADPQRRRAPASRHRPRAAAVSPRTRNEQVTGPRALLRSVAGMVRLPATVVAVLLVLLLVPGAEAHGGLPLGSPSLTETRTSDALAPGVSYTRIDRGVLSRRDGWTADVAVVGDRREARELRRTLRRAGFDATFRPLERAPDDPARGPLAYLVRSGLFTEKAEAQARIAALKAAGLPARGAVFTAEDGERTTGPWVVHVLEVDPARAPGAASAALSNDAVAGRETLSALAARTGSLAAVNGGYFTIGEADGTPGDAAGTSILDGRLVSEAVDGRTDLLLAPGGPSIGALSDALGVRASDGATRELDGLNREPGLIRSCGGTGGDAPTERPLHDVTCTDPGELVADEPILGAPTEAGPGVEALLDGLGRVTAVREPRGGPVPLGGSVLAGTGDGADWLRAHAAVGTTVTTSAAVQGEDAALALTPGLDVVNGGPRLLRDGRTEIPAVAEGFDHPDDPAFYYAFALRRNPRTIAGVTRDGRLLLVAVDGRAPGYSAGLDFEEEAAVMRALGARDAVNLDGGGSTTMTIRGQVVTRPSDATGERPIGDAVLVRPGA